ncbi:MAG: ABC transporter ATP-binding protein [Clostridia bacterium]|nr:ABC transporter ATP-binding protein [Clostridia bacterium]
MLRIENLTKKFGDKKVIDNLELEVQDGEIFGFIGHNGAGKTTTIKCMVGILEFDAGNIYINGNSIKENPMQCKKDIAYIPDNPDIYENLTGMSYLNFIADIFEIDKKTRDERISQYAEAFELKEQLQDLISSYSHGMKQKLVLISALIHQPKLLILDEPFVGLDPKASFTLKNMMKEMTKNGTSIFFSSHVLEVVEKLCDRIGIIKEGKLVTYGTVEQVKGNESLEEVFLELIKDEK